MSKIPRFNFDPVEHPDGGLVFYSDHVIHEAAAVEKARRDALRELGEQLGPDGWVNGDALVGLANKNTPPTEG